MKLNLSGLSTRGLIGLENRVIDLSKREIRARTSESELRAYYDECVANLREHPQYFEDRKAFDKTLEEVSNGKRAKLVARDSVYPGLFNFKHYSDSLESILNPEKRVNDRYFYVAHYLTETHPYAGSPFTKISDSQRKKIEIQKQQNKNPDSIIEIPNDRSKPETKASTIHETLHHVIINYQLNSGRLLTKDSPNSSKRERYIAEKWINERVTEYLTELLLEGDKEALFEYRWGLYELANPGFRMAVGMPAAIATGIALGSSVGNPKLLPLALVPKIAESYAYKAYKNSKREQLTKPMEKREFKI